MLRRAISEADYSGQLRLHLESWHDKFLRFFLFLGAHIKRTPTMSATEEADELASVHRSELNARSTGETDSILESQY